MRNSMKITLALAVTFVMFATAAMAQPSTLKVNIPFQFIAEGKTLPAGDYRIEMDRITYKILLTSEDSKQGMFLTPLIDRNKVTTEERASVVFHKYGDKYFLRHAWGTGQTQRLEWPESKTERELLKAGSPVEVALYHPLIK